MDLENLDKWARIKGIKVLGTGDFSHPEWLKSLKEELVPAEPGLFKLKKQDNGTRFILTNEISCIYKKNDKVRKVHVLIFAPSFAVVDKINSRLDQIGNLKSDGRPILGLDAKELAKIVLDSSQDCLVIPAHCLLPDAYLHGSPNIKMIKDISVGDKVYTHKGRLKKVKQIYSRPYKGSVYNIKPYYFRPGLQATPEHPFYVIKTYKNCSNFGVNKHVFCKSACSYLKKRGCLHPYFEQYRPQWIQAKNIEKGDVLIFPRFNNVVKDVEEIKFSDYLPKKECKVSKNKIRCVLGRTDKGLNNAIKINKNFCRLAGYYLSEGYTDNRDSISFCLNRNEKIYIKDLIFLMRKVFNLPSPRIYNRKDTNGTEIIYFSKFLAKTFSKLFYNDSITRRAHTKCLPVWMLDLPLEKQAEIFKGWWRGDTGYTSSRELMNQMKVILLRLGIVPSINEQTEEEFNTKYIHKYRLKNRTIRARHNQFSFSGLSFFQDLFGLLKDPCFNKKRFKTKLARRHGWIDERYIYIPVRDIEIENYKGKVYNLEVEKDNSYVSEFATVHNCWTPWFSVFGSKSGFDSIKECFDEYAKYIYAGETGLSADPKMFWRISSLDKITLISNSDSHSPRKIGREANVFDTELSYKSIAEAIKDKDSKKFLYTVEFFPEEGKYHYDGHRLCDVSLSPQESKKSGNICPVCGRPLTVGVLSRIEELADRPVFDGSSSLPKGAIPFKNLVPLVEIVADAFGMRPAAKRVEKEYENLIEKLGNEFNILLDASREDLEKATLPEIAEGIIRVRQGRVRIEPGYDGVYGKIKIFSPQEEKKMISRQKTLF
ncbi:MAG: LAGLIDADG family homing endonuclease [bacterium]|nr:LAGLIDADG family homing endonuclease [bacterium]